MVVAEIINIILPVFILLGIGFFVGKFMTINSKPVSDLCIYVFSPALFFHSVTTSSLNLGDLGRIVLFALLLFACFALLVKLLGVILKWNLPYENTMMLASAFPNTGNYGLPIILFAFGDEGMAIAIIYVVMQSLLMNSAGIFYASNHADVSKKAIVLTIIRMPGFIAITIGLILKIAGIAVPEAIGNATGLLGQAAVPVLLTLLGITLASIQIKTVLKFIGTAAILKLVAFPAIAFVLLAWLYPAGSLESKVLLISAATPAAATTTLLAIKFDMNPDMVSSAMFVSTLASIITIPLLLLVL
ncbi:AEC family transporter [Planococcus dechangensis]|uniref:AEC family transporter n=1 Tax=Planococcus dechangensis TaxID=1176255 RepID=A0ABV9MF11_9BACL